MPKKKGHDRQKTSKFREMLDPKDQSEAKPQNDVRIESHETPKSLADNCSQTSEIPRQNTNEPNDMNDKLNPSEGVQLCPTTPPNSPVIRSMTNSPDNFIDIDPINSNVWDAVFESSRKIILLSTSSTQTDAEDTTIRPEVVTLDLIQSTPYDSHQNKETISSSSGWPPLTKSPTPTPNWQYTTNNHFRMPYVSQPPPTINYPYRVPLSFSPPVQLKYMPSTSNIPTLQSTSNCVIRPTYKRFVNHQENQRLIRPKNIHKEEFMFNPSARGALMGINGENLRRMGAEFQVRIHLSTAANDTSFISGFPSNVLAALIKIKEIEMNFLHGTAIKK